MCYLNQDIYAAEPWYLVIPVYPLIILRALLHAETCKGDSKVCLSHHHVYFIWNYNTVRVNSIHLVVQRMSKLNTMIFPFPFSGTRSRIFLCPSRNPGRKICSRKFALGNMSPAVCSRNFGKTKSHLSLFQFISRFFC
jgi:hypothetical protein